MRTAEQLANEVRYTLMTMDETRIRKFAKSWGIELPKQPALFWIQICKAILACPGMPKGTQQVARKKLERYGVRV